MLLLLSKHDRAFKSKLKDLEEQSLALARAGFSDAFA
jgi:hypothetical protein